MAIPRFVIGVTICLLAVGCASGKAPDGAHPVAPQVAQAPPANAEGGNVPDGPASPTERKIIYTSQIEVVVDDLTAAEQKLAELIKSIQQSGGYLSRQESVGQSGSRRQSQWTIRVPVAKFDGVVAELESLGELQRNSREAQDVTDAFADMEARLRNLHASEIRLLNHLEKTSELKYTLEVERELSRVRGDIERLQGQLNLLANKSDLATVNLTLHERTTFTPAVPLVFSSQVSQVFHTSLQSLLGFGKALILAGVALSPWVVAGVIVLIPVWLIRRSLKQAGAKVTG
jgi:hypothetical protein